MGPSFSLSLSDFLHFRFSHSMSVAHGCDLRMKRAACSETGSSTTSDFAPVGMSNRTVLSDDSEPGLRRGAFGI
jgi:hypothetical protein